MPRLSATAASSPASECRRTRRRTCSGSQRMRRCTDASIQTQPGTMSFGPEPRLSLMVPVGCRVNPVARTAEQAKRDTRSATVSRIDANCWPLYCVSGLRGDCRPRRDSDWRSDSPQGYTWLAQAIDAASRKPFCAPGSDEGSNPSPSAEPGWTPLAKQDPRPSPPFGYGDVTPMAFEST